MISNSAWQTILATASDFSTVVEIYGANATPTSSGFNPAAALGLYASVSGITFASQAYTRLIDSVDTINRTLTQQSNTASVTFSNVDRTISRFEFANGFEGLIMVIRLISRSLSTTLAKSQVLFTGRCQKPKSGDKDKLTVTADWILGGTTVLVPRRKYVPEDPEGRTSTDPEFEGFIFTTQYGTSTYSARRKRGGILGLFGFKKTVKYTLAYSSVSDLDSSNSVPEVFGRSQLVGTHIGYADVGSNIRVTTAFCEGPIVDISSNDPTYPDRPRSSDSRMPFDGSASYHESLGVAGAANNRDTGWIAPGYYSHTAYVRGAFLNSAVDAVEPPPDLIGIIQGRTMTVPDGTGAWVTTDTWSDNGAAHTYFLLTSPYYFNLNSAWIDEPEFYATYQYNDAKIVDRSLSDFLFIEAG